MSDAVKPKRFVRAMTWKEVVGLIAAMTTLSGVITSVVGYIHAQVTIPQVLQKTATQVERALEKHAATTHPLSATKREIDLIYSPIEKSLEEFKKDTKEKLDRIEDKLDRM